MNAHKLKILSEERNNHIEAIRKMRDNPEAMTS